MWDKLVQWSRENFAHLPWRQNRTLYGTLVSEIMLQQTTVGAVSQHYPLFLARYPTLADLACASEEEVLISWKGLGYYRRAKNLWKAAQQIHTDLQGNIPQHKEQLLSIIGIGEYTSNALLTIGLDRPGLAVDANLQRVLARVFALATTGAKLKADIDEKQDDPLLKACLARHGGRAVNEALMDLGRTFCRAKSASCEICPLSSLCRAFQTNTVRSFPVLDSKSSQTEKFDLDLMRVLVIKRGKILSYQKKQGEWLSGQWELPTFILNAQDSKLVQYPRLPRAQLPVIFKYKTTITKYRITNHLCVLTEKEFGQFKASGYKYRFCDPDKSQSNLSTASLKALKLYERTRRIHE